MADNRRWWALAGLMVAMLAIGFDATILNVALPTLATALNAGTDGLQWIVDAYVLVFAGLLLPMGAIGDRFGRKRLILIGLVLFGGASVAAAYADGTGTLIAARALMGIGAAILTPIGMAVLPVIFPPHERTKAISYAAVGMGLGVPLGPIIGGYLLRHFWWGSVFLINVPVILFALVAVALLVPESKDPTPPRVDLLGAVLSTVGLVSFVYGVIEVPQRGWSDALVVTALATGVALLTAFVAWEHRTREPMIDLTLFARPRFLWGSIAATVASFALFGLLFVLPQYLQAVRGNDALNTGIRLLPLMAGLIVGARLSERLGTKIPIAAGLALIGGGLGLGATTAIGDGYGLVATWLAIVGLGTGLSLAPAMAAVLGELPTDRAGAGSALTQALRQVGGALGVALLGSLLSSVYQGRLPVAGPARESIAVAVRLPDPALVATAQSAYVHAMDVVLVSCGGVALAGAVLVSLLLPAAAPAREEKEMAVVA
jgi:EmrB/QacA subfamily drug resistance transporter